MWTVNPKTPATINNQAMMVTAMGRFFTNPRELVRLQQWLADFLMVSAWVEESSVPPTVGLIGNGPDGLCSDNKSARTLRQDCTRS